MYGNPITTESKNLLLTSFDRVQPIIWAVDGGSGFLDFDVSAVMSLAPVASAGLVDSGRLSDPTMPVFLKSLLYLKGNCSGYDY